MQQLSPTRQVLNAAFQGDYPILLLPSVLAVQGMTVNRICHYLKGNEESLAPDLTTDSV